MEKGEWWNGVGYDPDCGVVWFGLDWGFIGGFGI